MWKKQAGQCVHAWKHRVSTGLELEDIKMHEVHTRIEIRVRVWCMLRMAFDEVHVQWLVWGLWVSFESVRVQAQLHLIGSR